MGEFVRLEVDAAVGTIRLDRPPMNALNAQVQRGDPAGGAGSRRARRRPGRGRVRRPEGVRGRRRRQGDGAAVVRARWSSRSAALQDCFTSVARIPKPTIAAVTGYALGGGCELALCCDLRVAGDDAKLGQPEILLGIIPGAGGTQRLPRLVGPAKAKDLIFTGRFVGAEEALAIGLVDVVTAPTAVYEDALALAPPARRGSRVRAARREGVDRPRARGRPRDRPGDRAGPVRRAVRDRRPQDRHGLLRRERPRQGHLRTLTQLLSGARVLAADLLGQAVGRVPGPAPIRWSSLSRPRRFRNRRRTHPVVEPVEPTSLPEPQTHPPGGRACRDHGRIVVSTSSTTVGTSSTTVGTSSTTVGTGSTTVGAGSTDRG